MAAAAEDLPKLKAIVAWDYDAAAGTPEIKRKDGTGPPPSHRPPAAAAAAASRRQPRTRHAARCGLNPGVHECGVACGGTRV